METINNYTGTNPLTANACRDLEIFISSMDGAEVIGQGVVDTSDAVKAFNFIIARLNGQSL